VKKIKIEWNRLVRLANKYRRDAEKCLEHKAYFAGVVALRAALECILIARLLVELFDASDNKAVRAELEGSGFVVGDETIEIPEERISLKRLIETCREAELLDDKAAKAAHRIREWGNRIHCLQVFKTGSIPSIRERDLQRRFRDLKIVVDCLEMTL